jgi:hypothetical protein
MKSFAQVRESTSTEKKIDGIKVKFQPNQKGVVVYVEGDKLDIYPDMNRAVKMASEFVKQLKGMK